MTFDQYVLNAVVKNRSSLEGLSLIQIQNLLAERRLTASKSAICRALRKAQIRFTVKPTISQLVDAAKRAQDGQGLENQA